MGRNHLVGEDAEFEYCRVELWDQAQEEDSPVANTFAARKFVVSAEVTDITGENKQEMSGNLTAVGDPVDGTFNTQTKEFVATGAAA